MSTDDSDVSGVVERALEKLWGVVNELAQVRSPAERFRVTIFGSARVKPGEPSYEEVRRIAAHLSAAGCDIVTGGGPGLMQAANEGENAGDPENRTRSIGIRVELPFEQHANPYVENVYTHRSFFTRLHQFARVSDAFVVVPGGIGTTLETLLVWQLLQVKHMEGVPLILVGPMWRELVDWARRSMTAGPTPLASLHDFDIPICVEDAEAALPHLDAAHAAWKARKPG
jgi:uncharacterized protein (TIGR00730 family)